MYKDEFTKPQYVNADVLRATGISLGTFQTWLNRGLIKPSSEPNPGTGQKRMYSAADVLRAAIMGKLTDFGITTSTAAEMCRSVAPETPTGEAFLRMVSIKPVEAESHWLLFYKNGDRYEMTNHLSHPELPEAYRLESLIREKEPCVVLEIGKLVNDLEAKL